MENDMKNVEELSEDEATKARRVLPVSTDRVTLQTAPPYRSLLTDSNNAAIGAVLAQPGKRMSRISAILLSVVVVLVLSYGHLYRSYKFLDPTMGQNDFFVYLEMIRAPLDFQAAEAPHILRQIPTLAARLISESGIRYSRENVLTKLSLADKNGDDYFFALILSNYLAAVLGIAILTGLIFERYEIHDPIHRLIALVCLYALTVSQFNFGHHVVSPLTEGWAWLLLSIMLYLTGTKGWIRHLLLLVLPLSIFSRELLVVIFGAFCVSSLADYQGVLRTALPLKKAERLFYAGYCVVIFLSYVALRKLVFAGYDYQVDPATLLDTTLQFVPTMTWFFHGILSQNILLVLVVVALFFRRYDVFLVAMLVFGVLLILGLASGIVNNVGRILAQATPLHIVLLFDLFLSKRPAQRQERKIDRSLGFVRRSV